MLHILNIIIANQLENIVIDTAKKKNKYLKFISQFKYQLVKSGKIKTHA